MPINVCSGARRYGSIALLFGVLAAGGGVLSGCGSKPVAVVNGQTLSQDEFAKMCESTANVQAQAGSVGLQVLNQWILTTVEAQYAKEQKIYPTEEELNQRVNNIRKVLTPPGSTFEQFIQNQGGTVDAVRREELNRLITQKVMFHGVTVSDDDVRKAFDSQKAAMTQPEEVEISIITTDTEKGMKDTQADLNAGGVFANVATSRSKDRFRNNGGKIPGPLPARLPAQIQAQVPQAAVDAAFKMKPGQTSEPIKVGQTWVFVHLDNKIPPKEPNFDDLKNDMRLALLQQKAQQTGKLQENQRALMQAMQKAKIEIIPAQYQVISKRISGAATGGAPAGGAPGLPPGPPGR